jgi:hypothetical protein
MDNKVLMALQFSPMDREAAMALALLIRDVVLTSGGKSPDADFMFAARYDCETDLAVVREVGRAFTRCWTYVSTTQFNGWPAGPNALFSDTYRYFCNQCARGKWRYRGIWFLEPDCVPLSRDFIQKIVGEFRDCRRPGLGFFHCHGDKRPNHVNGNLLLTPEFSKTYPQIFALKRDVAWDALHAKTLMNVCHPSKYIWSDYRLGAEENPFHGCDQLWAERDVASFWPKHPLAPTGPVHPVWLHGIKAWKQAHECVRDRLVNKKA